MRALQITKQITKRESKSLERYLQEIGTIPRLTQKEEVEVAKRIEKSKKALERLLIREKAKQNRIKEKHKIKVRALEASYEKKQEELEKHYKENKKKLQKKLLEQKKQEKTTPKKQQKAKQNHIKEEYKKKVKKLQKLKEKIIKKLQKTLLSRFKKLGEQEKAKEEHEKKIQELEKDILIKLKAEQKHYKKELQKQNKIHLRKLKEKEQAQLVKSYETATNKHKTLKKAALKRLNTKHEEHLRNIIIEGKAKQNRLEKEYNEAIHVLVTANLRFGISVAKQYQNQGISLCDLINTGTLGLIETAKRYEHTRGFKFITYSVWWLRQKIKKFIQEKSKAVRMPLNRSGLLNKIRKTMAELEQKYERKPTIDEISEEIDVPSDEIWNTLQVSSKHVSLNTPFVEGEDSTLLDVLKDEEVEAPEKKLINDSLKKEVRSILSSLSPRGKEIICLFFGIGKKSRMTLDQIGEKLNLTRERVRQIKEKIITNMRNHPDYEKLKVYL